MCIFVQIAVKAMSHKGLRFAFLMHFEMQFTFLGLKSGVFGYGCVYLKSVNYRKHLWRKIHTMKITPKLIRSIFKYDHETGVITHDHKPREMFDSDIGYKSTNSRLYGSVATIERNGGSLYCLIGKKPVKAVTVALACMFVDEDDVSAVNFKDSNKKNLAWANLIPHLKESHDRRPLAKIDYMKNITTIEVNATASFTCRKEAEAVKRQLEALMKGIGFRGQN